MSKKFELKGGHRAHVAQAMSITGRPPEDLDEAFADFCHAYGSVMRMPPEEVAARFAPKTPAAPETREAFK